MNRAELFDRERLRAVTGKKTKIAILAAFNERMGAHKVNRMTFWYWWPREGHKVDQRNIEKALEVYPADDWRHEIAAALKEQQGA